MAGNDVVVVVRGSRVPLRFDVSRVFFAFGSGRFDYDCHTCGAQCCRGHGYSTTGSQEMAAQVALRPSIQMFMASRSADQASEDRTYVMRNCPPACFFLTAAGLCGVQEAHGYGAKPETCRLFPFNLFRRIADHLIVAPHVKLCPLHIVPSGLESSRSDHERLFADMAAGGISNTVITETTSACEIGALIRCERSIVALSERWSVQGAYQEFAAAQIVATRDALGCHGDQANAAQELMAGFVRILQRVLGAPSEDRATADNDDLTHTLVAVTPVVRSHVVFRPAREDWTALPLERVPRLLLVLGVLARCAQDAGMSRITYQSVLFLFSEYQALLHLLAWSDTAMVLRPDAVMEIGSDKTRSDQLRYLRLLKALSPGVQRRRCAPLGFVLEEQLVDTGIERIAVLDRLARRLIGRLVTFESSDRHSFWHIGQTIPRLQQWALGGLDERVLLMIGERQSRRRRKH